MHHIWFTSIEQGGAHPCVWRSFSAGSVCYHPEGVIAVWIQMLQQHLSHTGVTDALYLERAVSALHHYRENEKKKVESQIFTMLYYSLFCPW